jgi:hypothetical protein
MSVAQPSSQRLFKHKLCKASMEAPSTLDTMLLMVWPLSVKPLIYNGIVKPLSKPTNREHKKDQHFRQQASGHAMASSDMEGHVWRDALKTGVLLGKRHRSPSVLQPNLPLFKAGQSCLQWWAGWFKTAQAPPANYKAKQRPAWFSAEVLSHEGYRSIMYAGIQQPEMHCYKIYWWNGMAESVPEGFLQARIVTVDPNKCNHSNGRLLEQHPNPDIWQNFNTSNINARPAADKVANMVAALELRR